jgi:hypothetical protein
MEHGHGQPVVQPISPNHHDNDNTERLALIEAMVNKK